MFKLSGRFRIGDFVREFRARFLVRRVEAGNYLESFLIAAVASVLLIRLFLELADYPQIGGNGLHIAHLLWGGLLMCVALLVLLCLMGRTAEQTAAILGGLGFGTFIDEIGKFITSDNDYFYRPAVSLIYITFIFVFLLLRAVRLPTASFTKQENFINALREVEELVMRDLDAGERKRALELLNRSDKSNPFVTSLRAYLTQLENTPPPSRGFLTRIKDWTQNFYRKLAATRFFAPAVALFFIAQLALKLLYVFVLIFIYGFGWSEILDWRIIGRIVGRVVDLSLIDWIEIACSLASGAFVLRGVVALLWNGARARVRAYEFFARAMLIEIFLVQVFAFYKEQFTALFGLFINIAIYAALRLIIENEQREAKSATA